MSRTADSIQSATICDMKGWARRDRQIGAPGTISEWQFLRAAGLSWP
jgi:hypothetical protein